MNRDDIIRIGAPKPEPAPVAWMVYTVDGESAFVTDNPADFTDKHRVLPLYTTPLHRVHDLLEVHQAALEASEKPGPWPSKEVIDKAVAAEREACARVCEEADNEAFDKTGCPAYGSECAAAIRARGET